MRGEDFQDSLRTEAHDEAIEAQQVADDAVEASPARAVAVARDALRDADDALTRAKKTQRVALEAFHAALDARNDAEARS